MSLLLYTQDNELMRSLHGGLLLSMYNEGLRVRDSTPEMKDLNNRVWRILSSLFEHVRLRMIIDPRTGGKTNLNQVMCVCKEFLYGRYWGSDVGSVTLRDGRYFNWIGYARVLVLIDVLWRIFIS
jgi:predicted N-acyltransferase